MPLCHALGSKGSRAPIPDPHPNPDLNLALFKVQVKQSVAEAEAVRQGLGDEAGTIKVGLVSGL